MEREYTQVKTLADGSRREYKYKKKIIGSGVRGRKPSPQSEINRLCANMSERDARLIYHQLKPLVAQLLEKIERGDETDDDCED